AFIALPVSLSLMKFFSVLAVSVALLTSAHAMKKPSAHTAGTPTGQPTGPLKPGEYWWKPQLSPSGPLVVLVSVPEQTMHVYRNGNPIGRASVEVSGLGKLGDHVFSLLEGTTGRLSTLAPGRAGRRWMSVTSSGRSVEAEKIASRLRINPEFAHKVYDTI